MINVVFERAHGTWNKKGGGSSALVLACCIGAMLDKELCDIEMTLHAEAVPMSVITLRSGAQV